MVNEQEIIKKKIEFYLSNCTNVHINTIDKKFYNGVFLSQDADDIYTFEDRILGKMTLLLIEIYNVSLFKNVETHFVRDGVYSK